MNNKDSLKSAPSPTFAHSCSQRIGRVLLVSTFILAITYALFLVGQSTYWIVANPQNRTFTNFFGYITIFAFQALLSFSAISAIKQRNKTALGLAIIPLLMYSISLFAPNSSIKGFLGDVSNTDKFLHATSFCMVILLFTLTLATIIISIIRIVKGRQQTTVN